MNYSIIIAPLTTTSWSASEFSALHILEHIMSFGRNGQDKHVYFERAAMQWQEFMGTIRKNAILFEVSTLPHLAMSFEGMLLEVWESPPRWEYFPECKTEVIAEIAGRDESTELITKLYHKNIKAHYRFKSSGSINLMSTITLEQVQKVHKKVQSLANFLIPEEIKTLCLPKQIAASFKKEYIFSFTKQKEMVLQCYSHHFFTLSKQRVFEEYLLTQWWDKFEIINDRLPGVTILTIILPHFKKQNAEVAAAEIHAKFTQIDNKNETENMKEFEKSYLETNDRANLLEQWDKVVFES
jgi:hypothetical protein